MARLERGRRSAPALGTGCREPWSHGQALSGIPNPASVTGLLVARETGLARFFLMLQDPYDIKPGQILLGWCFCQKSKRAVYKNLGWGCLSTLVRGMVCVWGGRDRRRDR